MEFSGVDGTHPRKNLQHGLRMTLLVAALYIYTILLGTFAALAAFNVGGGDARYLYSAALIGLASAPLFRDAIKRRDRAYILTVVSICTFVIIAYTGRAITAYVESHSAGVLMNKYGLFVDYLHTGLQLKSPYLVAKAQRVEPINCTFRYRSGVHGQYHAEGQVSIEWQVNPHYIKNVVMTHAVPLNDSWCQAVVLQDIEATLKTVVAEAILESTRKKQPGLRPSDELFKRWLQARVNSTFAGHLLQVNSMELISSAIYP